MVLILGRFLAIQVAEEEESALLLAPQTLS